MNPGLHRGWRKAARDIAQLIAGGGLTELVSILIGGLSPAEKIPVLAAFKVLVTFLQNTLETNGTIRVLLPTPGLVPSAGPMLATNVGTVETEVETVGGTAGEVTGTVTDTEGELIGEVTGVEE